MLHILKIFTKSLKSDNSIISIICEGFVGLKLVVNKALVPVKLFT